MTSPGDDLQLEAYVPVYDVVPDKWEDAQPFLVEILKKISNAVNAREIGFFLDEELLSGKAYIPGVTAPGNNPGLFRQVLRYVADSGPLIAGVNLVVVPVVFDVNFQLIDMWVSATNSTTFHAITMSNPGTVVLDRSSDTTSTVTTSTVTITSPGIFDRSTVVLEYIQEL